MLSTWMNRVFCTVWNMNGSWTKPKATTKDLYTALEVSPRR